MRVLYFTEKDSPHDQRFLRALADTTHVVYCLRQYPCLPDTPEGVTELGWPMGEPDWSDWKGWCGAAEQLSAVLDEVKPDLVHAGPIQGPALLTGMTGFHPLVSMSWGSDLLRRAKRSPWMRYATRYTFDRTDVFIGDCQTVTDEAAKYGFPKEKMVRFPWGVDLAFFSPENGGKDGQVLRESLGWDEQFIILCNRSWSPIYGVDLLASAFVDAARENPNCRLLLVGSGPQSALIQRILTPIKKWVHYAGQVDRESLPGVYCASDLFVSPSHSDGSSVSLLEALACGRPVLVSDIPSNQEWVTPGEVGDLFRDNNILSLKEKIIGLAENTNLDQYGKRARFLAERRADWEVNFQKLLAAYQMAST